MIESTSQLNEDEPSINAKVADHERGIDVISAAFIRINLFEMQIHNARKTLSNIRKQLQIKNIPFRRSDQAARMIFPASKDPNMIKTRIRFPLSHPHTPLPTVESALWISILLQISNRFINEIVHFLLQVGCRSVKQSNSFLR